ncbi:hypothetical protein Pelo_6019 [Pelomyxa schiedti]|nr:hypothetical protein Pelo_6019 [Pelomyxa schiedti]
MGHIELAALIQHHLMPIVAQSPHIALFTIREFGITMEQVREYYNTLPEENALLSQTELNIWLSMLDVE